MRTFKIENCNGDTYDLNDVRTGLLHSVGDMGFTAVTNYRQIGSNYRMISDERGQDVINGTVRFDRLGGQAAFREFANFLHMKPLRLVYTTSDGGTYYREGTVTAATYSETDPLNSMITFKAFTPPYQTVFGESISTDSSGGKVYSYTYPYTYRSSAVNTVTIDMTDTVLESPVRIEFHGPMVNPTWSHYVEDDLVATGKLNYTIASGKYVVVDTQQVPYSIREYNSSDELTGDLYEYSNFSTERFIMLRHGKNRIVVSDDGSNTVTVKVQGKKYYAAV